MYTHDEHWLQDLTLGHTGPLLLLGGRNITENLTSNYKINRKCSLVFTATSVFQEGFISGKSTTCGI